MINELVSSFPQLRFYENIFDVNKKHTRRKKSNNQNIDD